MATEKDLIILEGVMKKKVSSLFGHTKWASRYYVLSSNKFTELSKKPSDAICNQQSLENSEEAKGQSWPVNSIGVVSLMSDESISYLKIVFKDGNCLQLLTPEPKAIELWASNIEQQRSMKEKEDIVNESVSRIIDSVENNWDEKYELDKNSLREAVRKKFFCSTDELQLEKLVIDDSAASLEKSKSLSEPVQFAENMHEIDTILARGRYLTPHSGDGNESGIESSSDGQLDRTCSNRGKKSNMSILNENLENFINIFTAYTELQQKHCETQDEMKKNSINLEKLRKQMEAAQKVIDEMGRKVIDKKQASEEKLEKIIQREKDLENGQMELQQISLRTIMNRDAQYRIDQKKTEDMIAENEKLEELHKKKNDFIIDQLKRIEIEENKVQSRDRNLNREMAQLKQKISEYNQRCRQLNFETQKVDRAEKKIAMKKIELEKKEKELQKIIWSFCG